MNRARISGHHSTSEASPRFNVRYLAGFLAVGLLLYNSVAQATPLGLIVGKPDISTGPSSVAYTVGGSNNFTVTGTATTFTSPSGTCAAGCAISSGSYSLLATISNLGALSGGTLNILGGISSLSIANGSTLLTGNLTNFGFAPDPATGPAAALEFLFSKTGGQSVLGFGSTGGVKINAFSISPGFSFASNWSTSSTNNSNDTFAPVPEPATILLLGTGAIGLLGFARRRLQHQT